MSLSKPQAPKHPKLTDAELVCQFARLSTLNKDLRELFEPRLRESMRRLVQQNRRLKIRLFYKDYSSSMLKEALDVHNQNGHTGSQWRLCMCEECRVLGKVERPVMRDPNLGCHLLERFLVLCEKLGLVVKHNPREDRAVFPRSIKDFPYNCTVYNVPDCDIFFGARGDWETIGYGELISKAAGTSSPKVKALQTLFCALFRVHTPAFDDGYETDPLFEEGEEDVSDSEAGDRPGIFTPEEASEPDEPTEPFSPELSPAFD